MPIYINNMLQQHTYTLDPNNYKNTQKWKKAAKKQAKLDKKAKKAEKKAAKKNK